MDVFQKRLYIYMFIYLDLSRNKCKLQKFILSLSHKLDNVIFHLNSWKSLIEKDWLSFE